MIPGRRAENHPRDARPACLGTRISRKLGPVEVFGLGQVGQFLNLFTPAVLGSLNFSAGYVVLVDVFAVL